MFIQWRSSKSLLFYSNWVNKRFLILVIKNLCQIFMWNTVRLFQNLVELAHGMFCLLKHSELIWQECLKILLLIWERMFIKWCLIKKNDIWHTLSGLAVVATRIWIVFRVDILQCPNGGRNTSKHPTMLLFLLIWYLVVIQSHQHSITRMTKKGITIFFASGGVRGLAETPLFVHIYTGGCWIYSQSAISETPSLTYYLLYTRIQHHICLCEVLSTPHSHLYTFWILPTLVPCWVCPAHSRIVKKDSKKNLKKHKLWWWRRQGVGGLSPHIAENGKAEWYMTTEKRGAR